MKQLHPLESLIFIVGGLLMVAGAVIYIVPALALYSPVVFSIGAVCYAAMQLLTAYEGRSIIIRRLRRQQILSDILLLATAALLMMDVWHIGPLRGDEWKLSLTVAAILQIYTAFRIPAELKKEA